MRRFFPICLFAFTSTVFAEPPQVKTVTDPQEKAALFRAWANAKKPRDFACEADVLRRDPVYRTETKSSLEVRGTEPTLLRILEKDAKGQPVQFVLVTEREVRVFSYSDRTEKIFGPRRNPRQAFDMAGWISEAIRNHLRFLFFHLTPEEIQARFQLEQIRQDRHYVYLVLRPRSKEDRSSIAVAHCTLEKATWATAQVAIESPNGDSSLWNIRNHQQNLTIPVTLESLKRDLPVGWPRLDFSR